AEAAARGANPGIVWHSGKLRAKQTAEAFWRACNPLAELSATRDLQPDDPPQWIAERLRDETRDILIAGHFPHLPRVFALLMTTQSHVSVEVPHHAGTEIPAEHVVRRADVGDRARQRSAIDLGPDQPHATGQERPDSGAAGSTNRHAHDDVAHEIEHAVAAEV